MANFVGWAPRAHVTQAKTMSWMATASSGFVGTGCPPYRPAFVVTFELWVIRRTHKPRDT